MAGDLKGAPIQEFKSQNFEKDSIYNLKESSAFEEENPHIFGSMYQFWCQKLLKNAVRECVKGTKLQPELKGMDLSL